MECRWKADLERRCTSNRAQWRCCAIWLRAGTTVSHDELLDAIWKTRHVVEDALTRFSQLRQSLGDDAKEARYIQTIPKIGYRRAADGMKS